MRWLEKLVPSWWRVGLAIAGVIAVTVAAGAAGIKIHLLTTDNDLLKAQRDHLAGEVKRYEAAIADLQATQLQNDNAVRSQLLRQRAIAENKRQVDEAIYEARDLTPAPALLRDTVDRLYGRSGKTPVADRPAAVDTAKLAGAGTAAGVSGKGHDDTGLGTAH